MSVAVISSFPNDVSGPAASSLAKLREEQLIAGSTALDQNRFKTDFVVPDMRCAGCISKIERDIAALDHVEEVRANLSLRTVSVIWNGEKGRGIDLSTALGSIGFEHHLAEQGTVSKSDDRQAQSLLLSVAVAGFAAANVMLLSVSVWSGADAETAQMFHLISGLIAVPAVAFAGQPFFRSAWRALSVRQLNMDVPISLAVLLALGMSVYESLTGGEHAYFDASVTLLFFLLIGRYLDHLMRNKARQAVEQLSSISAKNGIRVETDGSTRVVALQDIVPGMTLRVFPGERFPVNGEIITGSSRLDRSHVTGESDNAIAGPGEQVEAGALNLSHALDVEATSSAEGSFLSEMKNMMEAAENGRGGYTRIADRMARIYAPAVHILALVTFLMWMYFNGGNWQPSLFTAIAVLIITCPCALGLAVPVAHVIGAHRLMQAGVLLRDGTALERLAEIDSIVFDKTGTLTRSERAVIGVHNLKDDDVPLLKALASTSAHPVAKAVDDHFKCSVARVSGQVSEHPGLGVEGVWGARKLRFGRPDWVGKVTDQGDTDFKNVSAAFAVEGGEMALLELDDGLRSDAEPAIKNLAAADYPMEILSGDRKEKVEAIAKTLGIRRYAWALSPADKLAHVTALREKGRKVFMVGDGVNDAPSLVAGHVSMVPASACDVGRHAADFVFTRNSLLSIPFAIETAKHVERIVKQNFGLAIAYNCIAVPLAMAGYVTPLVAAIAMSLSSIAVVANSFRLYFGGSYCASERALHTYHMGETTCEVGV